MAIKMKRRARAAIHRSITYPWFSIELLPVPPVEKDTGLIKVELAGICGSDIGSIEKDTLRRELPPAPSVEGHEIVGTIVELGEDLNEDSAGNPISIGDRVVLMAPIPCGRCYYCTKVKEPSLCLKRKYYGGGMRSDQYPYLVGGFAEYLYLVNRASFIKIRKEIPLTISLLPACALRTVLHGIDLIDGIEIESRVVVQGVGSLGLMAIVLAKESGAKTIIAIGGPKPRLELALELGADHVIDICDVDDPTDRVKKVKHLTDDYGADLAFCCTSSSSAVLEGLKMLRSGGQYIICGYPGQIKIDWAADVVKRGIRIFGVRSSEARHLMQGVELIETKWNKYKFEKVVSHIFPLEKINEAFKAALNQEVIKAAIKPYIESA